MEFMSETPPKAARTSMRWVKEAEELRQHPGVWGKVREAETLSSRVTGYAFTRNIRRSNLAAFRPAGSFEAMLDKDGNVWARYMGD